MESWHLNTLDEGKLIDVASYSSRDEATTFMAHAVQRHEAWRKDLQAKFDSMYWRQIQCMLDDSEIGEGSDRIAEKVLAPSYTFSVTSCDVGDYCIPCIEAGLKPVPANLVW